MRLLPVLLFIAALAFITPAIAQPRDEAPGATPAGPTTNSIAEELTAKTTEEKTAEPEPEPAPKPAPKKEIKPVKKAEPKKEKKPAPKPVKKPETAKAEPKAKEPEAQKPAPAVSAAKEPVIVINPCTGDVTEEMTMPEPKTKTIVPGKEKKCLTERQCDALCRVGESFGEGGGAPYLSPRGEIVFGMEAFTSFDDCIETCGPKCK